MQKHLWVFLATLLMLAGGFTQSVALAAPSQQWVTPAGDEPATICSDDDRVASNDNRVGRFIATTAAGSSTCTAWLIPNGAWLTAGHCVNTSASWTSPAIVEFNVPASNPNGTLNPAAAVDRYPVNANSIRFRYDGADTHGADWAIFSLGPNATTGRSANQVQGFFRLTNRNPPSDAAIRITGYGTDDGVTNSTQQTDVGDYDGESEDEGLWHDYNVDTMGGNSGGPIIWEATGLTIGIHTSGGCDEVLGIFGSNSGTSFDNGDLAGAINNFWSPNVVHVDTVPHIGDPNGFIYNPFNSINQAIAAAAPDARISIVAGNYPETLVINKAVTLVAPVGTVVIGQ